jgi:hypothetical protein
MRSVTYGLSINITEICDSLSEAEQGVFSLLFGHPVPSLRDFSSEEIVLNESNVHCSED